LTVAYDEFLTKKYLGISLKRRLQP